MKVLHYSKYFPPYFGGIEKVAFDLVEGLAKQDIANDVLCFNNARDDINEQATAGYHIIRSGIFASLASTPLSLSNIVKFNKIADGYDVIHVHMPNPVANLAIFLARPKARIVLHWHSDIVRQKIILKFYDSLQQWLLRRADAILATSPPYAQTSPWLLQHADKVVVVPLGVDVSEVPCDANIVSDIKQQYAGRKIIFSLGRLVYYKGFEVLINAAKDLPDDSVVVIGGVGELEESLREMIVANKLEDKVFLVGSIPFKKLGAYFAACDVFCLPSIERSEAYGVVQMEAMFFGKPVVSANIVGSGVGWVNAHGESGLVVEPANARALAMALTNLLIDEELRGRLGQGARNRYEQMYAPEKMVEQVLNVYKRVLAD